MRKPRTRNPGFTTLKSFGRSHRDEPFHLVYPLVLYPKKSKIDPQLLNDWCAVRYLGDRKKTGARYRIETYLHSSGKRFVNRVMLERLTDEEKVELVMKFGTDFLRDKVIRDGRLRRPRLTKEEKTIREQWLNQFYADVRARRQAAIAAQGVML